MPMLSGLFRRPRNLIFLPPSAGCLFSNFRALLWRYRLSRLRPPACPCLTATAFFPCSSGVGSRSSTSPLAISIISLASLAGSRGRFTPIWPLGIVMQATKNDVSFLQLIDSGLQAPYCALEMARFLIFNSPMKIVHASPATVFHVRQALTVED